ncbi:MAG: trigger factor [Chloroflexota bacterium]
MNIEKQLQDNHSVKLIVEIDPEKINTYKRRAATKLSSRTKIPGFRPGKAPYDIIVRTLGEGAITEQAIDLLIDAEYSNILKEAEVNPGASGSLESIESVDPVKLVFNIPLAPEVDLGDYHSLRIPYEWAAPGKEDVDKAVEDLRQMYATTETVDREVQVGDYVLIDVKSETEGLSRTGFATFVRQEDRDTEWPYNGFARELLGLKPGESKAIKHTFPEDWEVEDLRGKEAEIEATMKTVRSVILPDLDDEFAKRTGAGETLDALTEAVTKDVEARSKADYDDKYFVDVIEKIKEGATIKYHEHAVEHESEHVLDELSQRLGQQGMDLETYFKVRNTTREKFIEEEVKPVAKKRLERSLVLDEIVRQEKIEVNNQELDVEFNNTINNLAMQGMDFSKIRGGKQGQKRVAEAVAMESATRVMTRRALDTLKSIATGEYKQPEEKQETAEAASEAAVEGTVEEAPVESSAEQAAPAQSDEKAE